jgi:hypothetical protein
LHIINTEPEKITKLRITYEEPIVKTVAPSKICNYNKLNAFAKKNIFAATVALYNYLDLPCFEQLVKIMIESRELSETDEFVANILYSQGALISAHEMRNLKATTSSKYIGYVNIFNEKFEAYLYTGDRYRDLTEREEAELIGVREKVTKPTDMSQERAPWGMIIPVQDKKKSTYSNVFKLLTAGAGKSAKTGIVCTSLQKPMHDTIMQQLGIPVINETKIDNCIYIAEELLKMNRMTLYPEYKPRDKH